MKGCFKMNSNKKRKKRQTMRSKISLLDIVLSCIVLVCALYAANIIVPLGLFPTTWIVLIGLVICIIILLTLIVSLMKLPLVVKILQRIFVCIVSAGLIFGTYTVNKVDQAVEEVIKAPESYVEYISILTLRDSGIVSIDALNGKYIGIQQSIDTDNMELATNYLESNITFKTKSYQDYTKAIQALYKKEVSAIVMSETYRDLIEENIEDFASKTAIIDAVEIEKPVVDIVKQIDITSNAFTVLVSGIDTLGSANTRSNSDVNMLITVNPLTKNIVMTSIPRDSYLPNACLNNQNDKLTHTGYYGMDCTIQTIENTFDIEINYYAKISFSSLINVVNALGGIEVDVPMSFCERKANRVDIIYINKGKQTLNGEQALALARNRHNVSGGDVGRAKNQQLIVNAIIKKSLNPDILNKIDELIAVVGETVQMNLTKKEIYSFVNMVANDLSTPWTISNNVVEGTPGWGECASIPGMELSVVELSEEEINKAKFIIKQATTDADLSELTFNINSIELSNEEESIEGEGETNGAKGYDFCWITSKQEEEKEEEQQEPEYSLDDVLGEGENTDTPGEEIEGPTDPTTPEENPLHTGEDDTTISQEESTSHNGDTDISQEEPTETNPVDSSETSNTTE